ncbi:hypothetical protein D9M69_455340 [compost metagenome]
MPRGVTVSRDFHAIVIDHFHRHTEERPALLGLQIQARLEIGSGVLGQGIAYRAQRRHLGHSPGVHHAGIEDPLESLDLATRCRRTTDHHPLQAQLRDRSETLSLDMLLQHHPHRRNPQRQGHPLVPHQLIDAGPIEGRARQHQLGPAHGAGVRHTPGVHVEHGHHQQRGVR